MIRHPALSQHTSHFSALTRSAAAAVALMILANPALAGQGRMAAHAPAPVVTFGSIKVDGLNIAYREAGDPASPKLVLLHGFPASSHQYRELIRALADRFHVIAPDYPGFGNSD
ncbi:MAG: alpha/beta fold hydrolase, partial [Gemmatimonadota bacterium]